jgi:hypothetical protein
VIPDDSRKIVLESTDDAFFYYDRISDVLGCRESAVHS